MSKKVIVNDNIIVKDTVCAAGSHMLYNFTPPFQAEAIDRLLAKGYELTGRANIGEFNMSGTETSWFGPTDNPLNADYLGSAAAAAVLEGNADLGLAVDCGDTLRLAAQSGCVAFRPTYGTVSRFGIIANLASSEQMCAVAKTTAEAAALIEDIAGHDCKDATSLQQESYAFPVNADVKGKKIAIIENVLSKNADEKMIAELDAVAAKLTALGAQVEKVTLPNIEFAGAAYLCMSGAEGCNEISRFDGVKYGYRCEEFNNIEELYRRSRSEGIGAHAKFISMLGTFVLSKGNYEVYYYKALQARRLVRDAWKALFESYDAAIMPVAAGTAYAKSDENKAEKTDLDRFWSAPSLIAGQPAVVIPFGKADNGLPYGLQIVSDRLEETKALAVAAALEGGHK